MDSSHVALVSMLIQEGGFINYRCEKNMALGINLGSLSKILKCAGNDDKLTICAEQNEDRLGLKFESGKGDRESSFDLKLMQIEGDSLGIPETDYMAEIIMSSSEFQRICRDLTILGETVTINVDKEEVSFSSSGDIGKGDIKIRKSQGVDPKKKKSKPSEKDLETSSLAYSHVMMAEIELAEADKKKGSFHATIDNVVYCLFVKMKITRSMTKEDELQTIPIMTFFPFAGVN